MTVRAYIALMIAGSGIAWLAWYVVLATVDPFATWVAVALFYASLGCALLGTLTAAAFVVRTRMIPDELAVRAMAVALRQALFGVIFAFVSLILLRKGIVRWWNMAPLIIALIGAEYIAHARRTIRSPRFAPRTPNSPPKMP